MLDFHVHAFPDSLAASAVGPIAAKAGMAAACDGTLTGTRNAMVRAGVNGAVLMPVATKPSQVAGINRWLESLRDQPGIFAFGALHPDLPEELLHEQLAWLSARGFRGVKMHPEYQTFYPDEDRLEPFYRALEAAGLSLLLHAGWDAISAPGGPRSTPRRILQVRRSFPGLKLILAHFGGFRLWDEVEKHLLGLPVFLDTALCAGHLPVERFLEMTRAHGADRVLFGSDSPWGDPLAHVRWIRSAGLTKEEEEKILKTNGARLLGLPAWEGIPPANQSREVTS